MEDESADQIPPELQVWVDTEIIIPGMNTPMDHQKLEVVLRDLPGVDSVNFLEGRVAIRHDPERITEAKLSKLISQAGYEVSGMESEASTPFVEPGENEVHTVD